MNRRVYFDFIESKLSYLAYRLDARGRLNILDMNLHSENFYKDFLNLLFGWKLENLNVVQRNAAGIDLVDTENRIVMQVSATATKQKVESSLSKDLKDYSGYSFKFISISKDAGNLRKMKFDNPHHLAFTPSSDIYDITSLLKEINDLQIDHFKRVYDFIRKELKREPDPEKVESNLTTIINILSRENWRQATSSIEAIPFEIEEKISFNELDKARVLIDDYKIHYHRIDRIYSEFNRQGVNKNLSILNGIRSEYLALDTDITPDQVFFSIIDKVIKIIRDSANYTSMPKEELELSVQILVVDAFIRCKIFKNPKGLENAGS